MHIGPRILKQNVLTDIFKGGTFLFVILLMCLCDNFSNGMCLYLFLHGSYGWCWIAKDIFFPDKTYQHYITIGSTIGGAGVLLLYWMIPIPLALRLSNNSPTFERMAVTVSVYVVGVCLMMLSDYQKYSTLQKRKGKC